jgi:hypothetical protein
MSMIRRRRKVFRAGSAAACPAAFEQYAKEV